MLEKSEYLPQRRKARKGDGPVPVIPSEGKESKKDFSLWSK
ncbi:MAG: hypothetical protein ACXW5W_14490 [Candidatus Binatia bacterium]